MRAAWIACAIALAACGDHQPAAPDARVDVDAAGDAPTSDAAIDAAPPGDPFAALAALPGLCSGDGWCWRWPAPHGNDYTRLWSSSPTDIWLGAWGTVMQWDGHGWKVHHLPVLAGQRPDQFVMSMAGRGPDDVWVIYGTALVHWDGAGWTIRASLPTNGNPNFNNVWVAPDGDAFVTQSNGIVTRWHGDVAQPLNPCSCFLGAVWGTSSSDVFITTLPAGILHYDGSTFSFLYNGPMILGGYSGVAGDVWISGGQGGMARWNGNAMTFAVLPPAIASRWIQPAAWLGRDDVWWYVLDSRGGFLHWDGTAFTFTPVDNEQDGGLPRFNAAAIIDGHWWLPGGEGALYTATGPGPLTAAIPPAWRNLHGMWGSDDHDLYLVVGDQLRHWDGAAMTVIPLDLGTIYGSLVSITGSRTAGVDELFVTGQQQLGVNDYATVGFHFDGAAWSKVQLEHGPRDQLLGLGSLVSLGAGEAMGFGRRGAAFRYRAGAWQQVASGTAADLTGAWAADADHVWAVGSARTVVRWERSAPDVMTADVVPPAAMMGPEGQLYALGPISGTDGIPWVADSAMGTVWRKLPAGWSELPAVTTGTETGGLLALAPDDVVISSAAQTSLWRYDGHAWKQETTGSGYEAPVLFRAAAGSLYAGSRTGHGIVAHP